ELRPAVGGEAAQREDVEERTARKQDDQQNREQESRYRKADDDRRRGPGVELRAIQHSLPDAERYRNQISQERHPNSERHRDRQLLLDQVQHADITEITLAEIEARENHRRRSRKSARCRRYRRRKVARSPAPRDRPGQTAPRRRKRTGSQAEWETSAGCGERCKLSWSTSPARQLPP